MFVTFHINRNNVLLALLKGARYTQNFPEYMELTLIFYDLSGFSF